MASEQALLWDAFVAGRDHETRLSPDTYRDLVAEVAAHGIDPKPNLMRTDSPTHPAGANARFRVWLRRPGGRRVGQPAATLDGAARDLLTRLRADRGVSA